MYRHASLTPAQEPGRHALVRRHLLTVDEEGGDARRRRTARRSLLGNPDTAPTLGSLGAHVGVDYVQVADEETAAWVVGVLRGHPGKKRRGEEFGGARHSRAPALAHFSLSLSPPDIAWAELDAPVSATADSYSYPSTIPAAAPPDDPYIPAQPALTDLGLWTASPLPRGARAAPAWARTAGSRGVTVCVMDSGLDYSHPDLRANLWVNGGEVPGNGLDDDGNGYVDDVHGTNVSKWRERGKESKSARARARDNLPPLPPFTLMLYLPPHSFCS